MLEPWEKQKGESKKAFEAFAMYRDMGSARSYAKTAQALGKSKKLMDDWGREWYWQQRVAAWDSELDRQVREQTVQALKDMNERHIKQATAFQSKALMRLNQLNEKTINDLSPGDAIRFFEIATKVERLARGEATEKVKGEVDHSGTVKHEHDGEIDVNHKVDLSGLSLEELNQLEQIVEKIAESSGDKAGKSGEVPE